LKSDVNRFERGQIWVYDDHKDKKDKKTCMAEKGILIGHRPVLIMSVRDKYITVIKGSRRRKIEKAQVEYNDGTGIGIFDTLQMEVLNTETADLTYTAKIENSILKEINNTINTWLFDYIDDYTSRGTSTYLKRQVWEFNDNGFTKTAIIVHRFKRSVILIPLSKNQHLETDYKFELHTDTIYTDISSIRTVSTDQLHRYCFTISEEIYSSILNETNAYLHGESKHIPSKEPEKPVHKKRGGKKHRGGAKHRHKKKNLNHIDIPEVDVPSVEVDAKNIKTYCPKAFKHLSFSDLVDEFKTHTSKELSTKYKVSGSTIRRTKAYIKEMNESK